MSRRKVKTIDDRLTRLLLRLIRFNKSKSTSASNKLKIQRNSSANSNEATTTTTADNKLRHRTRPRSDRTSYIASTDIEPNDDRKLIHQDCIVDTIDRRPSPSVSTSIAKKYNYFLSNQNDQPPTFSMTSNIKKSLR